MLSIRLSQMITAKNNIILVHKLIKVHGHRISTINSFKEIIKIKKGDCYV